MLYGELARFVLRLLGVRRKPKKGGSIQGPEALAFEGPSRQSIEAPKTNNWDNVWGNWDHAYGCNELNHIEEVQGLWPMGVCLPFDSSKRRLRPDTAFGGNLGEAVKKKLLGLSCFSQLCFDVPARAMAHDSGRFFFNRNCKVWWRTVSQCTDIYVAACCCCDISVGIECLYISIWVNSVRLRK